MEYCVVKLNTTGLEPETDDVVEISLIHVKDGKKVDEFQSLINPGVDVSSEIEKITGIENSMLKFAPSFDDVKQKILDFIGDLPLVGHNIEFDLGFLRKHFGDLKNKTMDAMKVARLVVDQTSIKNYKLNTLCEHYRINNFLYIRARKKANDIFELFEKLLPELERKRKLMLEMNIAKGNQV